ncbi:MAG: Ig-like domain-containing protein, partial [Gammaproteobacteria bacterium]|nr:Ig-like domain-containing protein [Gammaproteobacteria bacterium]
MITRFASLYGRLLVAAVFLCTITACGGGGGGGDSFYQGNDGSDTYFVALKLLDSSGDETSEVTSASPSTLQVTVTKNGKNGAPVADVVVSADATAGIISPPSGSALTDAQGIAVLRIAADPTAGAGAGTVTVSVDGPSGAVTGTLNFQIGSSGLRLGYLDADGQFIENEIGIEPDALLASQAIAQLSLVILDENGELASSAETVNFSSGCLASGQAALDPANPLVSGDGKVNTSYIAKGCSGNDQITASLEGSNSQAFGTLSVASSQANGFTFVNAVPATIVLRGTGGGSGERSESSTVTFRVVDSNNAPIGGIKVDFGLTTYVGGLKVSPPSAVSASDGLVTVNVFSGDVPTVVRVIAKAPAGDNSGQQVSSVSDILTVSTGLPDQNSFSVSVAGGFSVVDGMTVDGVEKTITVRMADKFNNPVPNGTAAVFTTEYGAIEPQCTTVDGSCSV